MFQQTALNIDFGVQVKPQMVPFYISRKLLEITSTTNCKLGGQKLLLPDSAAFLNVPVLPFLAAAHSPRTQQAALTVQFHHQVPERERTKQPDTKYAFPRTSTSSWLQK